MRKLGTFSTAVGFIFLGIWMILQSINAEAANQLFKLWPVIIIILGIEILIHFARNNGEERVKFNFLFILVAFIFIIINVVTYVKSFIPYGENWVKSNFNYEIGYNIKNLNFDNDKEIAAKKNFEAEGKTLYFTTNNGKITIKKSEDKNIKFDTTVYVNRNSEKNSYDINEQKISDGYKVQMNEDFVKGVEAVIYIPDGINVNIDGSNMTVDNEDNFSASELDLKYNNGKADLKNFSKINVKCVNGTIKAEDIKDVTYKCDNGTADLKGDIQNIVLNIEQGKIDIDNKTCQNVNANVDSGMVTVRTEDKNTDIDLEVESGVVKCNGKRRINAGITEKSGTGESKVKMNVNKGTISFTNQE